MGKMRVGPSEPAFRRRLQSAPLLRRLRDVVVSVGGKGVAQRPRQGGFKERSASEPLLTDRKRQTWSTPGALLISGRSPRDT